MNIAILSPTFRKYSGVDRVVDQQAEEFIDNGSQVTIFTLRADFLPERANLQVMGAPRNRTFQRIYRLMFPLDFIKVIRYVPKLRNFDLVISHQYPMNWLAYLAKRFYKVKYIYYNHGIAPPWTFSYFLERIYIRIISSLANWTIRRADGAVSISYYLQQQLKSETGLDSTIIHNRINTQRFHSGVDSSTVRDKYKLGNAPLILYVGRISPHKGVHLLIRAFNLVKQQIPNAKLLIVGKQTFFNYSNKLREMSNDSVIFTGYVADEDVPYYYAACDVYATCTLWEGFNLPLVEAQACGKPVVAFRSGPHPEVVSDGETGILVEPCNVDEFASGIMKALQGKDEMGEKTAKWAEGFARNEEADIIRILKDVR